MYLNDPTKQHTPEPTEAEQQQQLMSDLAAKLAKRTGQPWSHAPGVNRGLCVDCGGYRLSFEPSGLLRDRGRCNLKIEMFDRLNSVFPWEHIKGESWRPWPQVKLTKSAAAIANQLERDEVLSRMADLRKTRDAVEQRRRQDAAAATAGAEYIARDIGWLRVEPATGSFGEAHVKGTIGETLEMGYTSSSVYRKSGLVNLALLNIPLKTARKIAELIELEAIAQVIDQADDDD